MMNVLEVNELSANLGGRRIFENVSFAAGDGLTVLLGRNGCGKSTLIRSILGLVSAQGSIFVDSNDISKLPVRRRAGYFSYLPQRQAVPEGITVLEYTALGAYSDRLWLAAPGRDSYDKAENELERVGVGHLKQRLLSRISGGEARLAALARARMQKCRMLLMDEPLAGLDFSRQHEFIEQACADGTPLLMSLHDPMIAWQYADSILIMDADGITRCSRDDEELFERKLGSIYGDKLRFEQVGGIRLPIWHDR